MSQATLPRAKTKTTGNPFGLSNKQVELIQAALEESFFNIEEAADICRRDRELRSRFADSQPHIRSAVMAVFHSM